MKQGILTARHYAWFTLAFTAFVIYGSLVPFTLQPVPLAYAWERFSRAFTQSVAVSNRADWLANVLLFIPLGFVSMGWLSVDRTSASCARRTLLIASLLIVFALLSTIIEFVQIWFPPRHTSINDVVAETLGGAIGIGMWLFFGQSITDRLRRFWTNHDAGSWAFRLIPAYLAVLVIAQGMPFDLTLSPGDLGRKYRSGRVLPIPFTLTSDEQAIDIVRKGLIQFAYFLPAGLLIAGLPGWIASGRNATLRVLVIGILLAGAIEAMQLIIFSRTSDSTDIVTGSLAVLAGWRLMRYFLAENDAGRARRARLILLLIWTAALLFIDWEPFDFRLDSAFVVPRWHNMSFVPFADHTLQSFAAMFDKTLLFVPFGFLLASIANARPTLTAVGSALLLACVLEAGQFFLPRHTPGIGDLILATTGAWLGCLLEKRVPSLAPKASHS